MLFHLAACGWRSVLFSIVFYRDDPAYCGVPALQGSGAGSA